MKFFPVISGTFLMLVLIAAPNLFGETKVSKPLGPNLAHRGASYLCPENTLVAFKLAIQTGANGAECDVYKTTDGVLVLHHDGNLKRTAKLDGHITEKSFSDVQGFDVGAWKGRHFAGEKVPTLEEYILLMKGSGCAPVIELKQQGIEKEVVELVRKSNMVDESFIVTFNDRSLQIIHEIEPGIRLGWNFSKKIQGSAEENAEELCKEIITRGKKIGVDTFSLHHSLLSKKLVDLMHENGCRIWCWTVNDVALARKMFDMGVDTVCSDRPEMIAEILRQRKN